jgi:molecular chaperone GrpE
MPDHDLTTTLSTDEAAALQRERDELRDRLLRTAADFDNYRKRTDRERRDLSEAIAADIVRDVLPAVDDLERALAVPATGPAADTYRRGVELIHRQLLEALKRRGVEPIETVGQAFDPNWHESVAQDPAHGAPDGQITAEVRRGYRLGSRLVRAAQVRVAKA